MSAAIFGIFTSPLNRAYCCAHADDLLHVVRLQSRPRVAKRTCLEAYRAKRPASRPHKAALRGNPVPMNKKMYAYQALYRHSDDRQFENSMSPKVSLL